MLSTHGGAQDWLLVEGVGARVDALAAELGPRVCLSCSVTAIFRGDRGVTLDASNLIRHFKPVGSRSRKDTYMGSVYKAIAVYWHPTVGQLCVPAAGPDTRKRDQLVAAVRRNGHHDAGYVGGAIASGTRSAWGRTC